MEQSVSVDVLVNPTPQVRAPKERPPPHSHSLQPFGGTDGLTPWEVFDVIRTIRDPEHPYSLEELSVVDDAWISFVAPNVVRVRFNPTVPQCSLASTIGLCLRVKLERYLGLAHKVDIFVEEDAHETPEEVNKKINDKERVAAAMEVPELKALVERCIQEEVSDGAPLAGPLTM